MSVEGVPVGNPEKVLVGSSLGGLPRKPPSAWGGTPGGAPTRTFGAGPGYKTASGPVD